MTYNLTNITRNNGLVGLHDGLNDASGGLLMAFELLVIGFIILIAARSSNNTGSYAGAAFIMIILTILAWARGTITLQYVGIPIALFFFALLALLVTKE